MCVLSLISTLAPSRSHPLAIVICLLRVTVASCSSCVHFETIFYRFVFFFLPAPPIHNDLGLQSFLSPDLCFLSLFSISPIQISCFLNLFFWRATLTRRGGALQWNSSSKHVSISFSKVKTEIIPRWKLSFMLEDRNSHNMLRSLKSFVAVF